MIKRYSIGTTTAALRKRYGASLPKKYRPIVNAGSKKQLPILTIDSPNEFRLFNWGMIPSDSHDANIGDKLLNARVETLSAKSPFCNLLNKRCLIPADGFYVWKENDELEIPYRVILPQHGTFSILGLFNEFGEEDNEQSSIVKTFSMITCQSPEPLHLFSGRMPLLIPKDSEKDWLSENDGSKLLKLAIQFTQEVSTEVFPVSELLNNQRNNQPRLIQSKNHVLPGETLNLF